MKGQPPMRPLANFAATLASAFAGGIAGSIAFSLVNDGETPSVFTFLLTIWLGIGAERLDKAGWTRSYGIDGGLTWLWKDTLAMLIWPVLNKRLSKQKKVD